MKKALIYVVIIIGSFAITALQDAIQLNACFDDGACSVPFFTPQLIVIQLALSLILAFSIDRLIINKG